jgi:hypothetical protein
MASASTLALLAKPTDGLANLPLNLRRDEGVLGTFARTERATDLFDHR